MRGIRAGQRYAHWVTAGKEPLGAGGNGQVWLAEAADGQVGAIKILSAGGGAGGRYRLGRFSDEIVFLTARPGIPGILPLLDSHIADDPGEASWYVMPIARPIREALGRDPAVIVGAVGEIAATLATLALREFWRGTGPRSGTAGAPDRYQSSLEVACWAPACLARSMMRSRAGPGAVILTVICM